MAARILTGAVSSLCVEGGDAAELQARLRAGLAAVGLTQWIADVELTASGVGPKWLCQVSFVDQANTRLVQGGLISANTYVVQAGNIQALDAQIEQLFVDLPGGLYIAARAMGGGEGRDYMAVVILFNE